MGLSEISCSRVGSLIPRLPQLRFHVISLLKHSSIVLFHVIAYCY